LAEPGDQAASTCKQLFRRRVELLRHLTRAVRIVKLAAYVVQQLPDVFSKISREQLPNLRAHVYVNRPAILIGVVARVRKPFQEYFQRA
jgi:hypothetical protein